MRRRTILRLPLLAAAEGILDQSLRAAQQELEPLPALPGSFSFGVMGDSGSGTARQRDVARQMLRFSASRQWDAVCMLGDNIYENGEAAYFDSRFIQVYQPLFDRGVRFHAVLGNHDIRYRGGREMVQEEAFGFVGKQSEYEFFAGPALTDGKRLLRFVCLDSNHWIEAIEDRNGREQERLLGALRERLRESDKSCWNVFCFHHPIYSFIEKVFLWIPRGHGPSRALQQVLEPEIRDYADLVLAGHDHFYQKIRPQRGVHHVISGGGGKVRGGCDGADPQVEYARSEYHFMDFNVTADALQYQAIDWQGRRLHAGVIRKRGAKRLVDLAA